MTKWLVILLLSCSSSICSQTFLLDSLRNSLSTLPAAEKYQRLFTLADRQSVTDLPGALLISKECLKQARSLQQDSLVFRSLMQLGDISSRIPTFSFSDSIYQLAIQVANKMDDLPKKLQVNFELAHNAKQQGDWAESFQLLDENILIATELGDSLVLARALMRKGTELEKIGIYDQAMHYYFLSRGIYEAKRDEFRGGIVQTNIGMCLMRMKRYPEALEQFQTALDISHTTKDEEGVMINTLNIGVVYQKTGNLEEAKKNFLQVIPIARSLDSWYDIALCYANLGTTAMQQGRLLEAKSYLHRAIFLKDSLGYSADLSHTLNSLAEVHLKLNEPDSAILNVNDARALALKYHIRDQLSESYRITADVHASRLEYDFAYADMVRYKQLSDSLFTEASDQAISALKIGHETTLKENKIAQLTADNQRTTAAKFIFLGIGILLLITGVSVVYALYIRRSRDQLQLNHERELQETQNRFFANISHEFRTPLTLILGPIHQLRENLRGSKDELHLQVIQKNAERLLQLINQILDLARLDKKVLELRKENFNITSMITGIASSFDSLAESRHITFGYSLAENIYLNGDRKRLEILLVNLVSNAFKFTPDGGKIQIKAGIAADEKLFWMEVQDSGAGIRDENLSKIFDRYFHDDREAHSDFEGAGIGLALSKHIVEMHGGNIYVNSHLHQGTTFRVTLPWLEISDEEKTKLLEAPRFEYETEFTSLTGHRTEVHQDYHGSKPILLLVEDRKDMRQYISSILQRKYHLLEAADAFKGHDLATEYVPDIIISDVMMPGKNGLELCRELKTDVRTCHIPVILLTARSSQEDRLSGLETEADIYLTKPFIPEELELHVRNLVNSRKKLRDYFQQHRKIEPQKMAFNSVDEKFLENLLTQLEANYMDEQFTVEQLAALVNLSRSQLHRKLISLTGQAPNRLIRTFRLKKAYDMVSQQAASIAEIGFHVGFSSPAYFTKCFEEEFGLTPSEVKNKAMNA